MNRIFRFICLVLLLTAFSCQNKQYTNDYISSQGEVGTFPLVKNSNLPLLCIHPDDYDGVRIALENLRHDMQSVAGAKADPIYKDLPKEGFVILAGTLGESPWINELADKGLIPANELEGKWEKFILTAIEKPFPGIESALVIAGSDKRGTIYGIYDLSEKIGVSPWYYWADVPIQVRKNLFVQPGIHSMGEPKVKYRGIFINDEAPALAGWATETFGGFNHEFYEHVFELILRNKGNFLWPAMWGRAFYDDDSLNAVMADIYGVVIGTSHHEPLMRAHDEWRRYGEGPWNYEKNPGKLQEFWRRGIERMGENESIVTVGMRGDGDEPMTQGTAINLLEKIVEDQREIIHEVTGKPIDEVPQSWALYKEVQDYYDKGMRVPEDITLLLCDDNWGNIRKLPKAEDRDRPGGFGIYYHFDYVGGPRNYKWLNTNQIERTWEQMHLAYEYGARELWIVNVGDIKPMELPISFFLDYAWDPEKIAVSDLPGYYVSWAREQFGPEYSDDIADILAKYTKYNARRKPEMLSPDTYSLENYREAEKVVQEYNHIRTRAEEIYEKIDSEYRDAYFQLVLFPVQACANLNDLYFSAALNEKYAQQGRATTTAMAEKVEELFARDVELTRQYHEDLAGGKWKHMMSQTHIGYTYWQEPPENKMPDVMKITVPDDANMGVQVEGENMDEKSGLPIFPEYDRYNRQSYRIVIYNRGSNPFSYSLTSDVDWLKIIPAQGEIASESEVEISVDWKIKGEGKESALVTVSGAGKDQHILVIADNTPYLEEIAGPVFLEDNGHISIEASRAALKTGGDVEWIQIPNLGRTGSALASFPVNAPVYEPGGSSPHLEYSVFIKDTGNVDVIAMLSPTLNFHNSEGRRIAVSFDDDEPQILNIHAGNSMWLWEKWVGSNIIYCTSQHNISTPGLHRLNYWLVDPGLVLQKIVVNTGGLKKSYLGPPESYFKEK